MTYKEVVDRIELAVQNHAELSDFGYGQLSDIKVLDADGDGANYPYAFLVPAGASRQNQATTYSFSLIMMEMALTPQDILTVQSNCIQYLNDLIADLRFDSTFAGDLILNNAIQVFRERFQDEVAGATASFSIQVPDPINYCDTPHAVWQLKSNTGFDLQLLDTFENIITIPNPCRWGNFNTNAWRFVWSTTMEAMTSLEGWQWPVLSIYTVDGDTGAVNILGRHQLPNIGQPADVDWTTEIEVECPMSDTVDDILYFAIGDPSDEAPIADAVRINSGSLEVYYKRLVDIS